MGCATIIKTFVRVEEMHMARLKRGAIIASTLMLAAVIISACKTPYSEAPAVTNTPIDNSQSFFTTPLGETPGSLDDIARFTTETAQAQTGTPAGVATQTPSTPIIGTQDLLVTLTPTPLIAINPTSTATLAVSGTQSGTIPTSAPVGSRPASYTLQKGEFPYCIARRFDVDPEALLSLSGLSDGVMYPAGTQLRIPQSGSFPGARALRNHPATYTVASSDETIYSVACLFGDVDPASIAQTNNVSASAALTTGQQLSIP
jgi:LysM repeat protein